MHTVNIGISGDNHLIIAQALYTVLNIKSSLKEVEFIVFIDNLLCKPPLTKHDFLLRHSHRATGIRHTLYNAPWR